MVTVDCRFRDSISAHGRTIRRVSCAVSIHSYLYAKWSASPKGKTWVCAIFCGCVIFKGYPLDSAHAFSSDTSAYQGRAGSDIWALCCSQMFSIAQASEPSLCWHHCVSSVSQDGKTRSWQVPEQRKNEVTAKYLMLFTSLRLHPRMQACLPVDLHEEALKIKTLLSQLFYHVKLLPNIHSQKYAVPQEQQQ